MDNFLFSQKFDESPLLYVDQSFLHHFDGKNRSATAPFVFKLLLNKKEGTVWLLQKKSEHFWSNLCSILLTRLLGGLIFSKASQNVQYNGN